MWFLPHALFTFKKFCACIDNTFLVPSESHETTLLSNNVVRNDIVFFYRNEARLF